MPSQDYTADDSSNRCFQCSKMQLFEQMCESSHCRGEERSVFGGWFSRFFGRQLAKKWICPLRINCSTLFQCAMSSFSEKTDDHLFGSASRASNFCWIWLILKHPYSRLPFIFELTRVNPLFITCHRDPIFGALLSINRHESFFERLRNWDPTQRKQFFLQSTVHAILNVCWPPKGLRLSQSHERSDDNLAISVGAQHQWLPGQKLILDNPHKIRLGVNYDLG